MRFLPNISNRLSRMSIRYKLMLYLLIGLLPLLFLSIYFFRQTYNARLQQALLSRMSTAQANAGAVREFIESIVRAQEVLGLVIIYENITYEEISTLFAAEIKQNPTLETLAFVLPSRKVAAGRPSEMVGVHLADRQYFQQVAAGRDWAVSPLINIRPTGDPGFVIAHRMEHAGEFRGAIISAVSPKALQGFVTKKTASDFSYSILDSRGRIIVSTVLPDHLISKHRDRSWIPSVRKALRGESAIDKPFVDRADGVERMGASVPVPDVGWVVNVFEPVSSATALVRRAGLIDILLDLVIIAVLLMMAWIIGTRLADPIISLARKADAVARGDFSQRMETRDQAEIGTLTSAFNNMTAELGRSSRENIRLYEDLLEREEFQKGLTQLAGAVSSTLDTRIVLDAICREARSLLHVDGAYIWVLNEEEKLLFGAAACGLKADEFIDMSLPLTETGTSAMQAFLRKEGFYINDIVHSSDRGYRLTQIFETQSAIFQPLISAGAVLGVMVISDTHNPNRFDDRSLERAGLLAGYASQALANARAYMRERRIAETLQRGLLPVIPELVDHFEIAHYYIPARREAAIGGDFYDFIEIDDDRYGLVVGDVSGKGLEAAMVTAMAKYVLRAYTAEDSEPPVVLEKANNAIARYTDSEMFITLIYGLLDTHAGKFRYGSAGHEPVLVYQAKEKKVDYHNPGGMAAGLEKGQEYLTGEITLAPDDMLMLYTDGLTDARSPEGKFLDQKGLAELVVEAAGGSASEFLRALMDRVNDYTGGEFADDVAILVVRRM